MTAGGKIETRGLGSYETSCSKLMHGSLYTINKTDLTHILRHIEHT